MALPLETKFQTELNKKFVFFYEFVYTLLYLLIYSVIKY